MLAIRNLPKVAGLQGGPARYGHGGHRQLTYPALGVLGRFLPVSISSGGKEARLDILQLVKIVQGAQVAGIKVRQPAGSSSSRSGGTAGVAALAN